MQTWGGAAGGAESIVVPESSATRAAGGKEPQAPALPLRISLPGTASVARGGAVRGSGCVDPGRWRVGQAAYAFRDSRGITDGGEQRSPR